MQKDLIKDSVLLHLQNLAAAGVGEFLSAGKSLCGPITAVKQDSPSAPATQHALSTPSLSAVLTASKIAQPPTAAETAVVPVSPTPAETAAALSQAGNLEAVRTVIGDCQRCKLCARRTHIVFGTGDPAARLMFIGEGPGADEDEQGLPFVGRAGQLLTKMIQAMGLTREQVYIANIVKCRPPENRNPEDDEIAACQPFLMRQIEIIAPRVIVCLGKFAAQTILKTQISISKLRGQFWDLHGTAVALGNAVAPETAVMPTYHPAFLLRNPEMKKPVWEDLKKVMERLKS